MVVHKVQTLSCEVNNAEVCFLTEKELKMESRSYKLKSQYTEQPNT